MPSGRDCPTAVRTARPARPCTASADRAARCVAHPARTFRTAGGPAPEATCPGCARTSGGRVHGYAINPPGPPAARPPTAPHALDTRSALVAVGPPGIGHRGIGRPGGRRVLALPGAAPGRQAPRAASAGRRATGNGQEATGKGRRAPNGRRRATGNQRPDRPPAASRQPPAASELIRGPYKRHPDGHRGASFVGFPHRPTTRTPQRSAAPRRTPTPQAPGISQKAKAHPSRSHLYPRSPPSPFSSFPVPSAGNSPATTGNSSIELC